MAEEIVVDELAGKSLEELEAMEDNLVANSGEDQGNEDQDPQAATPTPQPAQPAEPAKAGDGDQSPPQDPADPPLPGTAKSADPAGDDPKLPPIGDGQPAQPAGDPDPAPAQTADQIKQDISPPSKWAKQRHEKNQLRDQLAEAQAKADKADVLEEQLNKIQGEMTWLKSALAGRNVEIPGNPLEMFTDKRLTEIQDEFGAEVADLFRATKAALGGATPEPGEPDPPAQPAKADPPTQPQAGDQSEDEQVALIQDAIDNNDHLTFWSEEKPELFQRAVEVDAAWLKHPEYLGLSYEERFKLVVKQVQDEQVTKGTTADNKQGGDANQDVPASLSGSGGEVPVQTGMTPYERVTAAPTPEKQVEIYQGLSEAERDQVDQQLGI